MNFPRAPFGLGRAAAGPPDDGNVDDRGDERVDHAEVEADRPEFIVYELCQGARDQNRKREPHYNGKLVS